MGFLINCRTCGKQVSSTAKMCPHCGERSPEPYIDKFKYSLIALLVIAIIIIFIFFLFGWI
ncbi:hypothetical protein E0485_04965 [Paenibacillus albiflavus]|uniref:Zinc-ribbon domain-containing protein n=1 Tax=Paenibacillus albiflavus TaxID=2545760 RepID=A0A4R4ELH3_9BACL|nr:hypothetical protein E0485_04965 [Paenibacillus albiflavus]